MRLSRKLVLLGIFFLVALINIRIGKVIMGFDNSSPFFSFSATWYRIFSTNNFFHYGGMLFTPALWLSLLSLPAWLNSYLTYFGAFIIGMFFSSLLIIERESDDKTNWAIGKVVLILLGSLIPIWMFSIPILIFAPSFAGVTAFLYLLLWMPTKGDRENIIVWVLLVLGLLYFYSTSINVAAFTLYFAETIILALLLKPKQLSISVIAKKTVVVALVWLAIVQSILIFRPHPIFILSEALHYGQELSQDVKSAEVTSSLFEMETQQNSILNVARFATGWLSLTDGQEKNLSPYKNYIDSIPGILITLAPVFLTCYFLFCQWKKQVVATRNLAIAWGVAIILCTSYALIFTQ
ncbi:hypothetical protein COX64_01175, partial [Candidatus Dojkabacteria bacterium CG_4_10_14_0_2_um_filter_Dojkabacteria_WS6_41_15]